MQQLKLTREDIQADIEAYQARIKAAQKKLAELPASAPTWKRRKKIAHQRRAFETEIEHVNRLIGYATEALAELDEPETKMQRVS